MKVRRLGQSGLRVSEIGLGTYRTFAEKLDGAASARLVRGALDLGINYFDTADVYAGGEAETMLGAALARVPREQFVVSTKCFFPASAFPNDRGLSRKHLVEALNGSLRRLGLDYVDLFLCHRFDPETPLAETLSALELLQRQGKLLYWGVSQWTAAQLAEAVSLGGPAPIALQAGYNYLYRAAETDMETASWLGVGTVAYSPLAQGVLSGKYQSGGVPPGSRAESAEARKGMWELKPESLAKVAALEELAARRGVRVAQLALAFCLRRKEVACALTGATSLAQLEQSCAGIEWLE